MDIYYLIEQKQNKLDFERAWEDFESNYRLQGNDSEFIISLKENIFNIAPYYSYQSITKVIKKGESTKALYPKEGLWEVTTEHRKFHVHKKGLIVEED